MTRRTEFRHTTHRPDRCCIRCYLNNVHDEDVLWRRSSYWQRIQDAREWEVGVDAVDLSREGQQRRMRHGNTRTPTHTDT